MTQPTINFLPCPFCGKQPSGYSTDAGGKWGWVQCCCNGPEVRTGYATDDSWHPDAANEWNTRAALTAQAGDGNRLPLEEVPEGWKLAWISHGKFGDAKFCAQIKRVDSHIAPNVRYAYRATPAEALRAAIQAAKDGA